MRLSYLAYLHHLIFIGAILVALFIGMMIQFKIRQAELHGEELGMIRVYNTMSIEALTEVKVGI